MAVKDWSTTASSNATADAANGINWAEGMSPAQVNDSARAMMAVLKSDFTNNLATAGYQKFPNGLIVQWGVASLNPSPSAPDHGAPITFPVAFPTAVRAVIPGAFASVVSGDPRFLGAFTLVSPTLTGCTFAARSSTATSIAANLYWLAVGH